jgi:hypothetical protein
MIDLASSAAAAAVTVSPGGKVNAALSSDIRDKRDSTDSIVTGGSPAQCAEKSFAATLNAGVHDRV